MGGENGIDQEPAIGGDLVAVSVRQFLNDAVSAEQAKLAADGGRAAGLSLVAGTPAKSKV